MEKVKNLWQKFFPYICIIFGNVIYALTIKLFVLPSGIALGGTTGIALIIEYFFHVPISVFVLIFNIIHHNISFQSIIIKKRLPRFSLTNVDQGIMPNT